MQLKNFRFGDFLLSRVRGREYLFLFVYLFLLFRCGEFNFYLRFGFNFFRMLFMMIFIRFIRGFWAGLVLIENIVVFCLGSLKLLYGCWEFIYWSKVNILLFQMWFLGIKFRVQIINLDVRIYGYRVFGLWVILNFFSEYLKKKIQVICEMLKNFEFQSFSGWNIVIKDVLF